MRRNFWKALAFCGACVLAFDSYAQTKAVYHDAGSKRITIAAAEQKLALQIDYAGGCKIIQLMGETSKKLKSFESSRNMILVL